MKQLCRRKTLFGNTNETHAVFCIDRSGSLYKLWDIICTHLVEHLCKMALYDKNAKFNVVVFDDQVESFRTKMTRVTTQSVFELKKWLQPMCHGSTSYLLPALMAAFGFTTNQCVFLVTDGLTSTESPQLFVHLPRICNGRPLHCILIKEESKLDLRAIELMAKLTSLTCCSNSSLQVVQVNYNGALIRISPEFWCPRIPANLYGNPEVCFAYILNAWANSTLQHPIVGTQDAGVETNATESRSCLSEDEKSSLALAIPDNDQRTLEKTLNSHFDGQPSIMSYSAFGSELPTTNGKLCAEANITDTKDGVSNPVRYHQRGTTCTTDPACCLCNRSGCCMDRGSVYSCPQTERMLRSRYQASRALIHGCSDLDGWKDNPCYAPSAGTLLLGRLVLAPNQTKGGALYLATVISQLTHSIFLISFEPPEVDGSQRHSVQEQRAVDMISFLDYHRHPVAQGDFVLVPKSALSSEPFSVDRRSSDRGYFMEPYVLAQVITGFEARGSVAGSNQLQEPLLIRLMIEDSQQWSEQNDQTFHVEPNAALWIPKTIVDRALNSNLTDFRPTTNEFACRNHTCRGTTDVMVLRPANHCPTYASAGIKTPKIPAAYAANELDLLASKSDEKQETAVDKLTTSSNHPDVKENSASFNIYCKDNDADVLKEYDLEANRLCRQFRDACTSVDKDLAFGRMQIHWKRRPVKQPDSKVRPQWRYWGTKSIPSLLDPPTFEPYRDLPSWEKTNRYSNLVSGDVVRPEIHFTKIPQRPSRLLDFRDSTQVHMALRDPPRTDHSFLARLPRIYRSTSDLNIHRMPVRQKHSPVCFRQTNFTCPVSDVVEYGLEDGHHDRIVTGMEHEAVNHGLHL